VAEQEAIRAKYIVDKAVQEKKAKIVLAEGEAAAIKEIGQKIGGNTAYLDLQRIKMATEVARVLGRSRNRVFLQSDTLLLNLHEPLRHDTKTVPVPSPTEKEK